MTDDRVDAYMALSPEGRAQEDRRCLGVIRRAVGEHIAQAMLSGNHSRQQAAWGLADDLAHQGCEVEYPIRNALKALGEDYDEVWVQPPPWDPWAEQRAARTAAHLRAELARHIAGAYVSGSDDQVTRARELETALDGLGVNVDKRVDSLVLAQMRTPPSQRGTGGRAGGAPF